MNSVVNVETLAKVMGYRLLVRASKLVCETKTHREIYWRFMYELDMKIEAVEHILSMKRTANRAASCDYDYQEALGQFYASRIRIALDNAEDDYGRVLETPINRQELGPFASIIDEIRGDGLFRIKVVDLV